MNYVNKQQRRDTKADGCIEPDPSVDTKWTIAIIPYTNIENSFNQQVSKELERDHQDDADEKEHDGILKPPINQQDEQCAESVDRKDWERQKPVNTI